MQVHTEQVDAIPSLSKVLKEPVVTDTTTSAAAAVMLAPVFAAVSVASPTSSANCAAARTPLPRAGKVFGEKAPKPMIHRSRGSIIGARDAQLAPSTVARDL